jgi:conjugal transfer ATP-binding protein TraC
MGALDSKLDLRAVIVLAVMFLIRQRMREGGRSLKKLLIIDEAWQLLSDGASAEFIEGFARRCRKEGGALVTGTQGINDYYKNEGARACLENSDWQVILRLRAEALAQATKSERLALDQAGTQLVESLKTSGREYSECLIQGPAGRAIGRLVLDPFSAALYSSTADDFEHIKALTTQGVKLVDAVYSLAFPQGELADDDEYEVGNDN